jgi:hypothetical protein
MSCDDSPRYAPAVCHAGGGNEALPPLVPDTMVAHFRPRALLPKQIEPTPERLRPFIDYLACCDLPPDLSQSDSGIDCESQRHAEPSLSKYLKIINYNNYITYNNLCKALIISS